MVRRTLTAVGLGMIAFGLLGLLRNADSTMPLNWLLFFAGGLIVHDALLAPMVMVAGLVLARVVPRRFRATLQGAAIVAGALVLVAIPAWTGNGRLADNPSILPQDYGRGLLSALAVLGVVTLVLLVRVALRPAPPAPPQSPPLPPVQPGW